MRSPEQALAEIASRIIHMRWKAHLQVGNLADAGSANALQCEMHLLFGLWLWLQEREAEFDNALRAASRRLKIPGAIPPHAEAGFRELTHEDRCQFVLRFWDEVAKEVGVDLTQTAWDRIKPNPPARP